MEAGVGSGCFHNGGRHAASLGGLNAGAGHEEERRKVGTEQVAIGRLAVDYAE